MHDAPTTKGHGATTELAHITGVIMKDPTIEGATMATLPNIPVNSAITIGALAVTGLVAYQQSLKSKIESQIHENYRSFKLIDAGMQPETTPLRLAKES